MWKCAQQNCTVKIRNDDDVVGKIISTRSAYRVGDGALSRVIADGFSVGRTGGWGNDGGGAVVRRTGL